MDHNITLDGSESDEFRVVSIYLDELPENVKMDLNLIEGGTLNDLQNILNKNKFESGSGNPVISINHTKEINVYLEE